MKRSPMAVASITAAALLLAGCASSAPDRAEVVERLIIEMEAELPAAEGTLDDLAEESADDAFDGMCGSDVYTNQVAENESFVVSWSVVCVTYFENDMTERQVAAAKRIITEHTVDQIRPSTPPPVQSPPSTATAKVWILEALGTGDAQVTWTLDGQVVQRDVTLPFSVELGVAESPVVVANVYQMGGAVGCRLSHGAGNVVDEVTPVEGQMMATCSG